jgi:hypothetical protein
LFWIVTELGNKEAGIAQKIIILGDVKNVSLVHKLMDGSITQKMNRELLIQVGNII